MNVYAIWAGDGVKFGVAGNPVARMAELQVGNPSLLTLVWAIACPTREAAFALERMIHGHLARERVGR